MKRILPPTLVLMCLVAMVIVRVLAPVAIVFPTALNLLGLVPFAFGLVMCILADRQFSTVGTTVNPFNEPGKLVTDGWFRYTRNPMYLGFALTLLGVWILLAALSPLLGVLAFVIITDRWYIPIEEQKMAATFGGAYASYQNQTRRWI